jgi:glutaredoxin-related protein
MWVAEKLDWKGLKIKESVGSRKIIMSDEVRHRIGKGNAKNCLPQQIIEGKIKGGTEVT